MNKTQPNCCKEIFNGKFELYLKTSDKIDFGWYFDDQFPSKGQVKINNKLPFLIFEFPDPVDFWGQTRSLKILNNNFWKVLINILIQSNIDLLRDKLSKDMTFGPLGISNKEKPI